MIPIVNINKLANGNQVDRRIVTEIESHSLWQKNQNMAINMSLMDILT